jgi:GNAT superfamily N-acetyltransferase
MKSPAARANAAHLQPSPKEMPSIVQIREWPAAAIEGLLAESQQEGFRFVRRAKEEWLSGANTFSKEGEALFAVYEGERLLAIGGINRESARQGRLRRFYVRRQERRRGIGRQLVRRLLAFASRHYSRVSLRCDTEAADRFYRAVGFNRTNSVPDATHVIELKQEKVVTNKRRTRCRKRGRRPALRSSSATKGGKVKVEIGGPKGQRVTRKELKRSTRMGWTA